MHNNKQIDELLQELRLNEIKYGYYILAVNLACIGYIVDKTNLILINVVDWLIIVSIISFTISFVLGLKFISIFNKVIDLKINEIMVNDFSYEEYNRARQVSPSADSEGVRRIFLSTINTYTINITSKQKCYRKWIIILFSIGAITFFIWKIISGLNPSSIVNLLNHC